MLVMKATKCALKLSQYINLSIHLSYRIAWCGGQHPHHISKGGRIVPFIAFHKHSFTF